MARTKAVLNPLLFSEMPAMNRNKTPNVKKSENNASFISFFIRNKNK